jgi:hypothetical protein
MLLSPNETILKMVQLAVENKGQAALIFCVLTRFIPESMFLFGGCNAGTLKKFGFFGGFFLGDFLG